MYTLPRRALLASLLAAAALPIYAQNSYPQRAITIVVPFPAGGPTDGSARAYAKVLADELGQPVVIDNRAGAAGTVGSAAVARSTPDGYTLLWGGTSTLAVAPGLYKNLTYDAQSFVPVGMALRGPLMIAASNASGLRSIADLGQRSKGTSLTVGSAGTGSIGHLATELFSEVGSIKLTHIPYRGGAPAFTDAIGGQIDLVFDTAAALQPFVKSGRLQALAVTGAQPYAPLPDVPLMSQALGKPYEGYSWFGLVAPKDVPAPALQKLRTAMAKAAKSEDIRRMISEQGVEPGVATPQEFGKVIASDFAKWSKVIQQAKVTVE
jgi:tripartite-type tricarboxylate transporter receptor subunit TctC